MIWRGFPVALLAMHSFCWQLQVQIAPPSSGEVTVRLVRPLDSASGRPIQISTATVLRSTNPTVPVGSPAVVQLSPDPSGSFALHLVRLGVNGEILRVASSGAVLASGGTVSGARVFLPQGTDIRFTLTTPPPSAGSQRNFARVPPPLPAHPSSSVVDLPPGAPGYPPLHASRPAADGCWWIPFVNQKFKLEVAVQQCAKQTQNVLFGESEEGITEQYQNPPLAQPDVIFTVHSKPAEQTIEAAIKQQFISKLKVPAARSSCRAKRGTEGVGKWDEYSVSATGPYANLKKFHSDELGGDTPCEGLDSGDVANYFLYQPAESKTKFIFVQGQSDLITILPYDEASIRFLPE